MKKKKQHNNSNHNVRREFKPCEPNEISSFIGRIQSSNDFMRKDYVAVSDTCHFERFVYAYGPQGEKVSIVYDTKGKKISYEAKDAIANVLDELYFGRVANVASTSAKQNKEAGVHANLVFEQNEAKAMIAINPQPVIDDTTAPKSLPAFALAARQHLEGKQVVALNNTSPIDSLKKSQHSNSKKTLENQAYQEPKDATIKLTISDRLKEKSKHGRAVALKQKDSCNETKSNVAQIVGSQNKNNQILKQQSLHNKQQLLRKEKIKDDKNQQEARVNDKTVKQSNGNKQQSYAPKKIFEGKQHAVNISQAAIVEVPAQFAKQQHTDSIKRLKKLIPNAFDYLGEQAKTDLTIGLIDIFNDRTRLSDYSVLLVPPYRGLEKLISQLQLTVGIVVKMIGQGFEKNDKGEYLLKQGYRKKIDSVVFNEVLSSLYTEYFVERHSCTHSDNTDTTYSRAVADLKSARDKYTKLLELIDYNCKKLSEIGFSV